VNLPLSPGATPEVYRSAFDSVVLPILADYGPELILVSAGYDAHELDPLGSMKLNDESYGAMARSLLAVAPNAALGVLLEGGYDLRALEGAIASTCDALLGGAAPASPENTAPAALVTPQHEAELARIRRTQSTYWHL
jgi:acetoin utilization deacetylase AcuC-like enzyme